MTEPHERKYQLISLSGGGYRAALYKAGLRTGDQSRQTLERAPVARAVFLSYTMLFEFFKANDKFYYFSLAFVTSMR